MLVVDGTVLELVGPPEELVEVAVVVVAGDGTEEVLAEVVVPTAVVVEDAGVVPVAELAGDEAAASMKNAVAAAATAKSRWPLSLVRVRPASGARAGAGEASEGDLMSTSSAEGRPGLTAEPARQEATGRFVRALLRSPLCSPARLRAPPSARPRRTHQYHASVPVAPANPAYPAPVLSCLPQPSTDRLGSVVCEGAVTGSAPAYRWPPGTVPALRYPRS